jgi:cytochrome c oxidase cbb3-type subunit 3
MRLISLLLLFIVYLPAHANLQLTSISSESDATTINEQSPIIVMPSPYSYTKTVANLKKAINGKNYRLIRVQKVDQGYVDKSQESRDLIVYFCNFSLVNKAVKVDKRIGQFLPCRISVIERDGQVYLMSVNPKSIGGFLKSKALQTTCDLVSQMYREIMDEVTI